MNPNLRTTVNMDLISYLPSHGLSYQDGVSNVTHVVPTFKKADWEEYCANSFIPWLHLPFACDTIHSSHLYWQFRDFQMPGDRYLQRSDWIFLLYGTFYIYIRTAFFIVVREWVVLKSPTGVVDQEFAISQDKIISLTFYFKITQNHQVPKYLLPCSKFIYICHCCY